MDEFAWITTTATSSTDSVQKEVDSSDEIVDISSNDDDLRMTELKLDDFDEPLHSLPPDHVTNDPDEIPDLEDFQDDNLVINDPVSHH